jgi:hypothetical protein
LSDRADVNRLHGAKQRVLARRAISAFPCRSYYGEKFGWVSLDDFLRKFDRSARASQQAASGLPYRLQNRLSRYPSLSPYLAF